MTTNYMNLLKETFNDLNSLTPEKLTGLVDETMKYFQDLQGKITSKEPGVREEALKESMALRETLEKQMVELCESTGLDPAQLAAYAEDTANMSPQDQAMIANVKDKLKGLQPEKAVKKVKRPTLKIVG